MLFRSIRTVLTAALRVTLGAEVTAVASARAAFEYLQNNEPPDVIILDGMMPEMDGVTTCRRLRADPKYCTVPIIFLTGLTRDSERAIEAGATACLRKPFDPMSIGSEILSILGESE